MDAIGTLAIAVVAVSVLWALGYMFTSAILDLNKRKKNKR